MRLFFRDQVSGARGRGSVVAVTRMAVETYRHEVRTSSVSATTVYVFSDGTVGLCVDAGAGRSVFEVFSVTEARALADAMHAAADRAGRELELVPVASVG